MFYWVLHGSNVFFVLIDSTGPYLVSLDFNRFYWGGGVLLGPTEL